MDLKVRDEELSSIHRRQSKILSKISALEISQRKEFAPDSLSSIAAKGARKLLCRWGHSACPTGDSSVIIFGGYGGPERHARLNDILELDVAGGRVRPVTASGTPAPMMAHTASKVGDRLVIIGGRRAPTCILNTVNVLNLKTLAWSVPEVSGATFSPRHRHAAAAVDGSRIYVYGGLNGTEVLGDLHMLDTTSWVWSLISCKGKIPPARHSHSLVAIGGKLYLFGGRGSSVVYGDLYVLDLETFVWSEAEVEGRPPSPRYSHTMTAVSHYLVVIGGCPITTQGSGLDFLDLASVRWGRVPISWSNDSLLVRHSTTVVSESLLVVGGGAVCFAFGAIFSLAFLVSLGPFLQNLIGHENDIVAGAGHSLDLSPEKCVTVKQELGDWALNVAKGKAKVAKDSLQQLNWLDPLRRSRVCDESNHVAFPILGKAVPLLLKHANNEAVTGVGRCGIDVALEKLLSCWGEVMKLELPLNSKIHSSPQNSLQKAILALLEENDKPISLLEELPKKWERLGDMIVLPATCLSSPVWSSLGEKLWRSIAVSLSADRVARQAPIASTGTRDSQVRLLYGPEGWVQHRENGILYCFDPLKCMFSSGNVSEKLRVASLQCRGATVVDLFAGIGYYVLPCLLKAGAQKVYACEWNHHAIVALRHNLAANGVEDKCEVIEGDNRKNAPQGVADIVSLGLLPTSEGSWPVAVRALRPQGGILLVHENVKDSEENFWIGYVLKSIATLAASCGQAWDVSLVHLERVKWYAPHIRHIVADIRCRV